VRQRDSSPAFVPVVAALLGLGVAIGGCVGFRAGNAPLERVDPAYGYRPGGVARRGDPGGVRLFLAFSGGGTRAAAFAYGVLEGLRDTPVVVRDRRERLLDEVDVISGVSGGSFPAAYYGLFGDRIFEDFEERFLDRNVQRALVLQALRPKNLLRLLTPYLTRSELASQYYDRHLFGGATFADLAAAEGPVIHINATDLSHGYRFTFNQGQFDVICSDLDVFPIARAVAASSAVPVLLSPVTLRNYAGRCGFELPASLEEALQSRRSDPRRYRSALAFVDYRDPDRKKYIHLIDGGIADNLGLRVAIEAVSAAGGIDRIREIREIEVPEHLVVIVVNAETDPNPSIDLNAAAPSLAALLNTVSGSQIRRYNLETILLMQNSVREWAAALSSDDHVVKPHVIEVSFDVIDDDEQRS
jgi:NTE family protein